MSRSAPCRLGQVAALGIGLFAHDPARAQQIEVAAAGIVAFPRSSLLLAGERETIAGTWLGGAITLHVGRVLLSGAGLRGNLVPVENTRALERDAGEVGGLIRFAPTGWLGLEATYTVRAFNSAAGYQRWEMLGGGFFLSGALGNPAVRAYARGSYLPSISVTGLPSPNGLAAEVGIEATLRRAPLALGLLYRFERYDFPGGAATRLEEFERIAVQVGYRLKRPP